MRGGGRHKDKKNKAEKKQAVSQERQERKCGEEPESDRGPAIQKKHVTSEEQGSNKGPASLKSLWRIEKDRAIQSMKRMRGIGRSWRMGQKEATLKWNRR